MNDLNNYDNQQTNHTDSSVSIVELVYKLLDKAILIILAAVLGAGIMGIISKAYSVTTYTSTSKLYLINSEDDTIFMSNLQAMNYLAYDYLEVFQTKELHQRVSEESGLTYTANELSEMVTAKNIEDTHIISITVTARKPEEAELLANVYTEATGSLVEEKFSVLKPKLFERATPAVKTVSSNAKSSYIIGAMGGLLISCVAVVLFAVFDDRVYTPEDLQSAVGIETLGIMTKQKKTTSSRRLK